MIKCPGCGAGMRFVPTSQKIVCEYCGKIEDPENLEVSKHARGEYISEVAPENANENVSKVASENANENVSEVAFDNASENNPEAASIINDDSFEAMVYTCPDCGAEILSDADTAVTFCNYCGNSVTLEGRLERIKKPQKIIPFKKGISEASSNYIRLIHRALFAPSSLTAKASIDKFRGIYMPYWSYDYRKKGKVTFHAYKSKRVGEYVSNDNYEVSTEIEASYEGLAYDASANFSDRLSNAIAPFNAKGMKDFNEGYMAGFYADASDVAADTYEQDAYDIIEKDMTASLRSINEVQAMSVINGSVNATQVEEEKEEKIAYFPVWFLANRYGDKVSYAVVNGQTGEVAADIPISYGRYIVGSLMLAFPLILIFNMLFTIRSSVLLMLTVTFSIISMVMANNLANQIYTRLNFFDDWGMQIKKYGNVQRINRIPVPSKNEEPWYEKFMPILGFAIFMVVVFLLGYAGILFEETATIAGYIVYLIFLLMNSMRHAKENKEKNSRIVMAQPMEDKIKYLVKQMIAIVVCIGVLIISPTMDYWYYGAAILAMLLTLFSFWDLVLMHNKLTMRKPPQFNVRGGE